MKKLLSLLTISMLATSAPAPLLADITLVSTKHDIVKVMTNSNNDYLPLANFYKNIGKNAKSVAVDNLGNIYFGTKNGAFSLKQSETKPTKINGINGNVVSVAVDNNNNVYFGAGKTVYKLTVNSDTPIKINGINEYISSIVINYINNVIYIASNFNIYYLNSSDTKANLLNVNFIEQINSISVNKSNDLIIGGKKYAYILKHGTTSPIKIEVKGNIRNITFSVKDDIYFSINNDLFVMKKGSSTRKQIKGINNYILSATLSSNGDLYFGTENGVYTLQTSLSWTKEQSHFILVDNSKTQTWTRNNLLTVDGELNIDINNNNIDKVLFDNILQPQTAKKWTINVKPETSKKDHNLQVFFTLAGKQYTSKIIVSMQAKIDPPTPSKQENLSDVIKFGSNNNLGNILDNNNENIISAITQKNYRIIDFSQITIEKKDIHSATLTAKKNSKSYQGSIVVKYNVVPANVVDLKIDLKPTSPATQVDIDYVGQIDTSNITNQANTFYYANSESKITMKKPNAGSVITGVIYGCDEQWNKISQLYTIDQTNGIVLDDSQLTTSNGKYVVELSDNLGHTNNVYLQIASKQEITKYFDTDNGKQFEMWAKANGHDGIRGYSAIQLNKLFEESKSWIKQASDSQFANAIVEWFKANGKLTFKEPLIKTQVIEQLKTQIPSSIIIDGLNTSNYDVNKVRFELNQNEFKLNNKVKIIVKYNDIKSYVFTLQIENSNSSNNDKKLLTGWAIVGVFVGSLSGLLFLGWLLKKFVIISFICEQIRKKKAKTFAEKTAKDIAQIKKDEAEEEAKRKG
ncbi:hypothetical protein [Spiroplasma endosymbiont of Polydrusus formosus]|uniref:hypothetical protein n=1 Tax=Spiroplasma endosymbiont of Polydrusus formosus TaxID=3139326 RepID=UPI0035B53FD9